MSDLDVVDLGNRADKEFDWVRKELPAGCMCKSTAWNGSAFVGGLELVGEFMRAQGWSVIGLPWERGFLVGVKP